MLLSEHPGIYLPPEEGAGRSSDTPQWSSFDVRMARDSRLFVLPEPCITNKTLVPTYFVYPKDKSTANAILILTDIIGHVAVNVQLIADQLAANGYFVVIPDLFHGDPVELGSMSSGKVSLQDWLKNHGTETVDPVIQTVLKELRGPLGAKKIGSIGYCFGAKYVVRFLKDGHLDAGFVAHPSFVSPEELRAITGPLSIAAAGKSSDVIAKFFSAHY